MTDRPKWNFSLTIEQVRALNRLIIKVKHHWEFTSADTTRDWITFCTKDDEFVPPVNWTDLFEFKPYYAGLIQPNWNGRDAIKAVQDIDAFEAAEASDRAELERLKRKFGEA